MTAKEMFKELGYEEAITLENGLIPRCVGYIKHFAYNGSFSRFNESYKVIFWLDDKDYTFYIFNDETESIKPLCADIKLHKAINKKMKELGWLE